MDTQHNESRRGFLKKAAYAAPAVIALGSLSAPVSAQASVLHLSGNGLLPRSTVTADYDNVANKYSNVTRSGPIGTLSINDRVANTSPFRTWLRSIFGV